MAKRVKGFTLIEIMIVVFIFTLLFGITFGILGTGRRSWQIGTAQVEVQQETRKAVDALVKDLREASSIDPDTFVNGVSENTIRFTLDGQTIEYAVNNGQLQKNVSGIITIVANEISQTQFRLLGGDIIYILVTAQRDIAPGQAVGAILNSQVVLRN